MTRLFILVGLSLGAVAIALILQRRRPDPPSAPSYRAPSQLDRDDFGHPSVPILLALFASTTCDTCPRAWETVQAIARRYDGAITAQRIDVQNDPELHKRYRIDGVPTTVVADPEGVVQEAFFGPMTDEQLLAILPPPPEHTAPEQTAP